MVKTLLDLRKGDQARIVAFKDAGQPHFRQKLLALGLIPGVSFIISKVAPFGDPIELMFNNGLSVSVRKKEVEILELEGLSCKT